MANISHAAHRFRIQRSKPPLVATGVPVLDQIRKRCTDLGYSMSDLDQMVHAPGYFRHGNFWRYVHPRYVSRAVVALGGALQAAWTAFE